MQHAQPTLQSLASVWYLQLQAHLALGFQVMGMLCAWEQGCARALCVSFTKEMGMAGAPLKRVSLPLCTSA
jgi:hypothetical protein